MLYRIVIKSYSGNLYYLTSADDDTPETDIEINFDEFEFLSNLNPTHAHTFSTKKLAQNVITKLPYPYNEKAIALETLSKEDPIIHKVYYRIAQILLGKLRYISNDKKFTKQIEPQTTSFPSLDDAKEFFNSLPKLTKKISCIVEVHDFGPPNYNYKNYFITSTGEKSEEFQINVIYS